MRPLHSPVLTPGLWSVHFIQQWLYLIKKKLYERVVVGEGAAAHVIVMSVTDSL